MTPELRIAMFEDFRRQVEDLVAARARIAEIKPELLASRETAALTAGRIGDRPAAEGQVSKARGAVDARERGAGGVGRMTGYNSPPMNLADAKHAAERLRESDLYGSEPEYRQIVDLLDWLLTECEPIILGHIAAVAVSKCRDQAPAARRPERPKNLQPNPFYRCDYGCPDCAAGTHPCRGCPDCPPLG